MNITFSDSVVYESGQRMEILRVSDFNNDNNPDIISLQPISDRVCIFLGAGDGSFGVPSYYGIGGDEDGMELGDLNNDGSIDIAVIDFVGPKVSILIGKGDGTFFSKVDYEIVFGNNRGITLVDINNDGNLDVITTNANPGTGNTPSASTLIGRGDGTFNSYSTHNIHFPSRAASSADIDGDGRQDLISFASRSPRLISILFGNGNGAFVTRLDRLINDVSNFYLLETADINNDGKFDILFSDFILLGKGNGAFEDPIYYGIKGEVSDFYITDFDNNTFQDIVLSSQECVELQAEDEECEKYLSRIDILLNQNGTFFSKQTIEFPDERIESITSGDFNGDNKTDVSITKRHDTNIYVLINKSTIAETTTEPTTTVSTKLDEGCILLSAVPTTFIQGPIGMSGSVRINILGKYALEIEDFEVREAYHLSEPCELGGPMWVGGAEDGIILYPLPCEEDSCERFVGFPNEFDSESFCIVDNLGIMQEVGAFPEGYGC
ncbi:MAG: VCBS repeat-containing protein [Alphaproteobacteria bacterium]|nr:VCBS repeat-containing protein [Alphaproteobacteria bacterium]